MKSHIFCSLLIITWNVSVIHGHVSRTGSRMKLFRALGRVCHIITIMDDQRKKWKSHAWVLAKPRRACAVFNVPFRFYRRVSQEKQNLWKVLPCKVFCRSHVPLTRSVWIFHSIFPWSSHNEKKTMRHSTKTTTYALFAYTRRRPNREVAKMRQIWSRLVVIFFYRLVRLHSGWWQWWWCHPPPSNFAVSHFFLFEIGIILKYGSVNFVWSCVCAISLKNIAILNCRFFKPNCSSKKNTRVSGSISRGNGGKKPKREEREKKREGERETD